MSLRSHQIAQCYRGQYFSYRPGFLGDLRCTTHNKGSAAPWPRIPRRSTFHGLNLGAFLQRGALRRPFFRWASRAGTGLNRNLLNEDQSSPLLPPPSGKKMRLNSSRSFARTPYPNALPNPKGYCIALFDNQGDAIFIVPFDPVQQDLPQLGPL